MPNLSAPSSTYPQERDIAVTDDPTLSEDATAFHSAFSELIRIYQFRDRDRICCYDISVTQCYALETLALKGPLSVNQLAAGLYLDKSTTSRVAGALERKGYLERSENPADRRSLLLKATDAGRKLHARIEAEILMQEQELLGAFPPDVRESMTELIAQLARVAARRVNNSGGTCTVM